MTLAALLASLTVVFAPCPMDSEKRHGCTATAGADVGTIYVNPSAPTWFRGPIIRHEQGHHVSAYLSDAKKLRIRQHLGWNVWHEENFASRFATCYISEQRRQRVVRTFVLGFPKRDRGFCHIVFH